MSNKRGKKKDNKRREFKLSDNVKLFCKLTEKKFKKKEGDYYDSKKELKKAYYGRLFDLLPDVITTLTRYGHIEEVQEKKNEIYEKLTGDEKFIKYISKEVKDGFEVEELQLLPTIIFDILVVSAKYVAEENAKRKEAGEELISYDLSDLIELSELILKKKIKKFKKKGIDEKLAFDVLSTIPTAKIMKKSQYYRLRQLFNVLYESAKDKEIPFSTIMKLLFKDEEEIIASVIVFALLERKEVYTKFKSETQKKLYNDISDFSFKTLEEMKKDNIYEVLETYARSREKDVVKGKDSNRRYYISSLPEADYPKITKQYKRLIEKDEKFKSFF